MIDYSLLKTKADCDTAEKEIDFELQTFTTRDANLDLADVRAERSQTSATSRLASLDGEIMAAENLLAATGIADKLRENTTDNLALLRAQRTKLAKRTRLSAGVERFLAAVDAKQVEDQVASLTAAKAGIGPHRDTLTV